ncbi:MAG: hypothetical protein GY786_09270 [Proteobacteria bacterium]|nr:hypothetical protein [Pseudomonadota bacterium]
MHFLKAKKLSFLILLLATLLSGCQSESKDSDTPTIPTYKIGGTLSGNTGLVVLKNGTDYLVIDEAGSFYFTQQQEDETSYEVTVIYQPPDNVCYISNASGTVTASDVDSVVINCYTSAESPIVRSQEADTYLFHYGTVDTGFISVAKTYPLVVLHPYIAGLTRATVEDIQKGFDPKDPLDDVVVIGYISIGEDLRTASLSDAQMLLDSRFTGDGTGPSVDPRGPDADGESLQGISQIGTPTGGGYASWYLDDNSVDQDGTTDKKPDRNPAFGGAFVNAGDPAWYDVIDQMTFDNDGFPGLQEILTTTTGRGLGMDGVFLDTIDTAAPNFYTNSSSFIQTEFEWTAPGMTDMIHQIRDNYSDKVIFQNRGLFYFDPRRKHFKFVTRKYIDLLLFESYRLNSNTFEGYDSIYFPDNRYNVVPKLMAEANRSDGFRVLSLGYAAGPDISSDTLVSGFGNGYTTLIEDITETLSIGFRHYLTNALLTLTNSFVKDNADLTDNSPPFWDSTYNDNSTDIPAIAATPRVGIQKLEVDTESAVVHWDVALDKNKVGYALYHQTTDFDFNDLRTATRTILVPELGDDYESGIGPTTYPYKATVENLSGWSTYYFMIRAFDNSTNANEDSNEVVSSTFIPGKISIDANFEDWAGVSIFHTDGDDVPDSNGPDWTEIKIINDTENLYIKFKSANSFNLDGSPGFAYSRYHILIDVDNNSATGFTRNDIGSDLLVSGWTLFSQDNSGSYTSGTLATLSILPKTSASEVELKIPLSYLKAIDANVSKLKFIFLNDEVDDSAPDTNSLEYDLLTY